MMLAIGPQGELLARIQDDTKPTGAYQYRVPRDSDRSSPPWLFRISANKGKVRLDDFKELSFRDKELNLVLVR